MRVPLDWLTEFLDLDLDVETLVRRMDEGGIEVEGVHHPGAEVEGVRTARVATVAPHPRADGLVVADIDVGGDTAQVVVGVRNFSAGDVVAWAAPGARIADGTTIGVRDIRGVTSHGMLCSPRELGLFDDHEGILVLDPTTPVGADARDVLPLGRPVLDIAVMADRGDHLSILGIARDLGALLDRPWREPATGTLTPGGTVPIRIDASDGCRHYVGWVLEEVGHRPAPWWMRYRLEACGVRSLGDAIVDITNYVALELGQPLHAFDLDRLAGGTVVVRWAAPDETIVTLDGRERRLGPTDLVIADAERAVAVAGVMGGADSEVTGRTRRILLEAAVFDPAAVRRTARRLGLSTEASIRFERGVDPTGARRAAARAVALATELGVARDAGAAEAGSPDPEPVTIRLHPVRCASLLGVPELDADRQRRLLERSRCTVEVAGEELVVQPPPWRMDLRRPADLAEEVLRLHGYQHVPATLPPLVTVGGRSPRQRALGEVHLAARAAGLHEVQTIPFVAEDALVLVAPDGQLLALANPISQQARFLRPSLAEGLLGAVRVNVAAGRPGVGLYEVGRIFRPAGGALDRLLDTRGGQWRWAGPDGRPLPTQPLAIGMVLQGLQVGERWLDPHGPWDPYPLLAVVDEICARLGHPPPERVPAPRTGLHPTRTVSLLLDGTEIGVVGQLHPAEAERRDLPEPVIVGEVILDALWGHLDGEVTHPQAPQLVRFPPVTVDVALVAEERVPYAELEAAIREGAGVLLEELWWFDEYRGPQIGEGRRSIAVRLQLRAADRQLTDEDAEQVIEAITVAAARRGAVLRR